MADQRTTLLIPNLHCPTCIAFIKDYIGNLLPPKPSRIDVSILQHQVVLEHDETFDIFGLCEYFGFAGYYVSTKSTVNMITGLPIIHSMNKKREPLDLTVSLDSWEDKNHLCHCASCRNAFMKTESDMQSLKEMELDEEMEIEVIKNKQEIQTYIAQFTIEGMTCSSCVGNVTKAIEAHSWVISSNIVLLSGLAIVRFTGSKTRTDELIETIEELGYEVNLENVDSMVKNDSKQIDNVWKAKYSVEGMRCSSCVSKVTNTIKSLPFVRSTNVNLLLATVDVEIEGKSNLVLITTTLQDLGYKTQLEELKEVIHKHRNNDEMERKVMVNVIGMTCNQCPLRISNAIQKRFGDKVKLYELPTWQKAIFEFSYSPQPPNLTIRTILNTINEEDETFFASLFQPVTIEEKAQKMHAKIRFQIFYRAILASLFAIPTFVIGIVYMALLPDDNLGKRYFMQTIKNVPRAEWVLFGLSTPIYFCSADLFHRKMMKELYSLWRPGSRTPILQRFYRFGSMDMLMSLGTSIAYFSSIAQLIISVSLPSSDHHFGSSYFDSVVFLTMFLLLGRLLEAISKEKTGEAISKLGNLRPKEAILLIPETKETKMIPINLLETGDFVKVVHGSSPPWDGRIIQGSTTFSEASLTGESGPIKKCIGDLVYSGTTNSGESVIIQLTGSFGNSMLDQIINTVREGQSHRAPIERIADRLTSHFVPLVTLIAILTWIVWLSLGLSGRLPLTYLDISIGGWPLWSLHFAIAVFVIACPCGIGLAAPTALFIGGGLAAHYGILVKGGGEAFQEASKIDILIFDKTGTLTKGEEMKIIDQQIVFKDEFWQEDLIKQSIWTLEQNSSHPIAKNVYKSFQDSSFERIPSLQVSSTNEVAGKGIKGIVKTENKEFEMIIGNKRFLTEHQIRLDKHSSDRIEKWQSEAKTVVLVAGRVSNSTNWIHLAMLSLSDPVRPEASKVIASLQEQGIEIWMVSGDTIETAKAISKIVGIPFENVIAGVLPEEKAKKVQELQRKREIDHHLVPKRAIVAMVGDGVNDSPALAVADVAIAIGSGSDVAISTAGFVLINSNLNALVTLISLSKKVFQRVKFNFAWALLYNLIALPVAAGILYPLKSGSNHVRLDPVWASLAMALSSISVVCSSLLLRTRIPLLGYTDKSKL